MLANSIVAGVDSVQARTSQVDLHPDHLAQTLNPSSPEDDTRYMTASSDLWSAAYREAVESLGENIDMAILASSSATQLFAELEGMNKGRTQQSAFLSGVAYLRSIQVPLKRFKLALDLASPLSNLDPTASTVIGVVRSVTAVSIPFSFSIYKNEYN